MLQRCLADPFQQRRTGVRHSLTYGTGWDGTHFFAHEVYEVLSARPTEHACPQSGAGMPHGGQGPGGFLASKKTEKPPRIEGIRGGHQGDVCRSTLRRSRHRDPADAGRRDAGQVQAEHALIQLRGDAFLVDVGR